MESRSIEEIQGVVWPPPIIESPEVLGFHKARKTPVNELSPRELFILFNQKIERPHLVDPIIAQLQAQTFLLEGKLLEVLLSYFASECDPSESQKLALLHLVNRIPEEEFEELTLLEALIYNFRENI